MYSCLVLVLLLGSEWDDLSKGRRPCLGASEPQPASPTRHHTPVPLTDLLMNPVVSVGGCGFGMDRGVSKGVEHAKGIHVSCDGANAAQKEARRKPPP